MTVSLNFDNQPELHGQTLALRPLQAMDLEGLYTAASDPRTWAGHPVKDRYKREVFLPYFKFLLECGGTLVVIDVAASKIIGCSRYYQLPDQHDGISIGFTFLSADYWGGTTNRELKKLMLDHAFRTFDDVWFHIAPDNIRSQKASSKFGAKHFSDETVNLTGTPALWKFYRLSKDEWRVLDASASKQ